MVKIFHLYLRNNPFEKEDLSKYKYLIFDGKYLFGRKFSLLMIFDALDNKPIICHIGKAENKKHILPFLRRVKKQGLNPKVVTLDGLRASIFSFKEVWPNILIQRCIFHIKLQINAWTRIPPRTKLGHQLSRLANSLLLVKTKKE